MHRLLSAIFCCLLPSATAFSLTPQRTISTTRISRLNAAPTTESCSSSDITQDQYNNLMRWFRSKSDKSYISPKFSIGPSPAGGYGAFASQDLEKGELLLRIPRTSCLTLDDVFNDVDVGPSFQKLMEQAGPGSDTVIMAGYLAKEYLMMEEYRRRLKEVEEGSSIDASAQKRLEGIKFGPYLQSLPWQAGVNAQDHVLFWEDEEVERLLKGSLAYDDAIEIRNSVSLINFIPLLLVWRLN